MATAGRADRVPAMTGSRQAGPGHHPEATGVLPAYHPSATDVLPRIDPAGASTVGTASTPRPRRPSSRPSSNHPAGPPRPVDRPAQRDHGVGQCHQPRHRVRAGGGDREPRSACVADRRRLHARQQPARPWSMSCCSAGCWPAWWCPTAGPGARDAASADQRRGLRAAAAEPGGGRQLGPRRPLLVVVLAAPLF